MTSITKTKFYEFIQIKRTKFFKNTLIEEHFTIIHIPKNRNFLKNKTNYSKQ